MRSTEPCHPHGRTGGGFPNIFGRTAACTEGVCLFLACERHDCCGRWGFPGTRPPDNFPRLPLRRCEDAACRHCIRAATARAAVPRGPIPFCESHKAGCEHPTENL